MEELARRVRQRLEQLAFGEGADEAEVGGKEVVSGQGSQRRPADFVEDAVADLAGEVPYGEELEVDGTSIAIAVADLHDAGADDGCNAKLLVEFAYQGLLGGLAGLDPAAGERPLQANRLIWPALTDQDFGGGVFCSRGAKDQGRDDQPKRLSVCAAVA